MSGRGLLDADMATLATWIRQRWSWWLEELAAMVPAPLRGQGSRAPIVATDAAAIATARPGPARLAVDPRDILVRTVPVPPLGSGDLRRFLLLDLERLMPLPAAEVFAAIDRVGERHARVAIVRKATAREAVERARQAGIVPVAVGLREAGEIRVDFLPAMRADGAVPGGISLRNRWWLAAAVLLVLNLTAMIVRDTVAVEKMREAVDDQGPALGVATTLRNRVAIDERTRATIVGRRLQAEPLRALAAISETLPGSAWVQRYAWNARQVRLTGYKKGETDVAAALRRSPLLANVRSSTADVPAQLAAGEPFDITADLRRAGAAAP